MSLSLQLWSPSKLRRATCLACSPFIFAFIAFNILDLDGSNLASLTKCSNRLVIDAEVGPSARVEQAPIRLRLTRSVTRYTSRAIKLPQAFAPAERAASLCS